MEIIVIATVIETAIVLIIFALLFIGTHLLQNRKLNRKKTVKPAKANNIEAKAIILTIEETGILIDRQPQMRLQVQVIPEKGRNFVAETNTVFAGGRSSEYKTGSIVTVMYNPANVKEVALIKAAVRQG